MLTFVDHIFELYMINVKSDFVGEKWKRDYNSSKYGDKFIQKELYLVIMHHARKNHSF